MSAPTAKQLRALQVLEAETKRQGGGPVTPARFGELMYPGTAGHVNAARGLAPHAARSQAAGSVLARLRKLGWVTSIDREFYAVHHVSNAGLAVLAAAETQGGAS